MYITRDKGVGSQFVKIWSGRPHKSNHYWHDSSQSREILKVDACDWRKVFPHEKLPIKGSCSEICRLEIKRIGCELERTANETEDENEKGNR